MWFLVFVIVASAVGIAVVLIRHRRPTSMEASISEFGRSLDALAPDVPADYSGSQSLAPEAVPTADEPGAGSTG